VTNICGRTFFLKTYHKLLYGCVSKNQISLWTRFDALSSAGVAVRHSADCNAVFHLRHHWHAGL